jgi:hypothetical protein
MERSELFLLDADDLVSTLKRRDAQASGPARLRTRWAAKELGDLLRSIELPGFSRCAYALAERFESADPQSPFAVPPDQFDRLTQRLDAVLETLRRARAVQDDAAFAESWLSVLTSQPHGPSPQDPPTGPVSDRRDLRPWRRWLTSAQESTTGPASEGMPTADSSSPEAPVVVPRDDSSTEVTASKTLADAEEFQRASLEQARQLHASQACTPLAARPAIERVVNELLVQSRRSVIKLNHHRLRQALSVATEVWAEVERAVAMLPSAVVRDASSGAQAVRIDLDGVSIDDPLCIAAGDRISLVGGRVDAHDEGVVIRVPLDYWRPMALPVQQPEGWAAVYALQTASIDNDTIPDPERRLPAGLLLRVGTRDILLPMNPARGDDASPTPVWRHLLPAPAMWPQPLGWRALASDVDGRLMPLLVPLSEGHSAGLNEGTPR